jgi:hypothetical protein
VSTRLLLVALVALACASLWGAPAHATRIGHRTILMGAGGSGDSDRAVVSDDGTTVAFDSNSPSLTGTGDRSVRDVFVHVRGEAPRRVSEARDGSGSNGASTAPAISADGFVTAFASTATNLFPDPNGKRDVFARIGIGPVGLISIGADAEPANGASGEPDVSADGTVIVYSSKASNLVRHDTNRVSDIFVLDLKVGVTRRVSQTRSGEGGNGPSSAPAVSPDGRYVSFYSEADNLVPGDRGDVPDVFLADLRTGRIRRVSVSSRERAQNASVEHPFVQISDVSRGGRYVVFDSDADNLVPKDRRHHTDVFLRDVRKGTTQRMSVGRLGESNSDSVYPRITPNGRFVTFESFANNLFPLDSPGASSYLYDRRLRATTLLDVRNSGRPVKRGTSRQLLQRPSVSADGNAASFVTFAGLAGADGNDRADAYLRLTTPARARIRVRHARYRIRVDDPKADLFFCRFKSYAGFCPKTRKLAGLRPGRYTISVRAWAGGMRLGPVARVHFRR